MGTDLAVKRVRRAYSKQFKSEVVAECKAGEKSVSGVAIKYGMNANIVHKWLRLAEAGQLLAPPPSFIPVAAPVRAPSMPESRRDIQINAARGERASSCDGPWKTQPIVPPGYGTGCDDPRRPNLAGGRADGHARR